MGRQPSIVFTRPLIGLSILAQWPLCAALARPLGQSPFTTVNGVCVLLALASLGLWLLGCRPQGFGRIALLLVGSLLLTGSFLLSLRSQPALWPLFLGAGAWILTFLQLFKMRALRSSLIALAVASVSFTAALAETALEVWPTGAKRYPETAYGDLSMVDESGRARLIPNASCRHVKADFDVVYHTEADGGRRIPQRPDKGPSWLCFGCSFAFGEGLDDSQTIPAQLQKHNPGYRLYNYAMMSKSTADAYLQWPDRLVEHSDAGLCVYFLIADHFFRDSCPPQFVMQNWAQQAPRFVVDANNHPVLKGKAVQTVGLWDKVEIELLKHSRLYAAAFGGWHVTPSSTRLTTAILEQMQQQCKARPGCRFLLVCLPEREPRGTAEISVWARQLQDAGMPVLDLSTKFSRFLDEQREERKSYYLAEGHPNGRYAKLIADWVTEYVRA